MIIFVAGLTFCLVHIRFAQLVPNGTPDLLNKLLCTLDALGRRDVSKIVSEYTDMQSGVIAPPKDIFSSDLGDDKAEEGNSLTGLNIRSRFGSRLRGLKDKLKNNKNSPTVLKGGYLERMLQ